jgi:uncharacterized protein (DUF362 family)
MRPRERIALHIRNLQQKVAELNAVIHPDLIIMDARKCFISGGPYKGDIRSPDLIIASSDPVALDLEGIRIIQSYHGNSLAGLDPYQIAQIERAMEMGLGAHGKTGAKEDALILS